MEGAIIEGLTFDDVLLLPGKSSILPAEADTRTCVTRKIRAGHSDGLLGHGHGHGVAPGDRHGPPGRLGFIHRNMTRGPASGRSGPGKALRERDDRGPGDDLAGAHGAPRAGQMNKYRVSGLPVTRGMRLVGILTNRDLRFERNLTSRSAR